MSDEIVQAPQDFESVADNIIDGYFSERGVVKDLLEIEEKKFIIKELALANKKSEIIPKLNELRRGRGLPELQRDFDIFYYAREYAPLIEDISLHYAANLAKKYRFANRITRIAKLNAVAETVLERIRKRDELEKLISKEESLHNDNIKLFAQLLAAIDEQMGKLKITKVDVSVREGQKPLSENPADVKKIIEDALKQRFSNQLPQSVDANFTNVTDYTKCGFGEEWSASTHCRYFNEQCKVQAGEISLCPHFINKILFANKEWLGRNYHKNNLSVRQICELAGCKEIDEKVLEYGKQRLRDAGLYRNPSGADK